jgi:hypothetical protein
MKKTASAHGLFFFAATLWLSLIAGSAAAVPVVVGEIAGETGGIALVVDAFQFEMAIFPEPEPSELRFTLWEGLVLDAGDVGQEFRVDAATDGHFAGFVAALSDNQTSLIAWYTAFVFPGSELSSDAGYDTQIFAPPPIQGNVDLAGIEIRALAFRLDELVLATPGRDLNGDHIWTDYSWRGSLLVYAVPEPCGAMLVVYGLIPVIARGYRRRKK